MPVPLMCVEVQSHRAEPVAGWIVGRWKEGAWEWEENHQIGVLCEKRYKKLWWWAQGEWQFTLMQRNQRSSNDLPFSCYRDHRRPCFMATTLTDDGHDSKGGITTRMGHSNWQRRGGCSSGDCTATWAHNSKLKGSYINLPPWRRELSVLGNLLWREQLRARCRFLMTSWERNYLLIFVHLISMSTMAP